MARAGAVVTFSSMAISEKATEKVVVAFRSLGQGLRAEEIAAATGLAETTVRAVLTFQPELPRLADFYKVSRRRGFDSPHPRGAYFHTGALSDFAGSPGGPDAAKVGS
jgi:hypothetical protein